jgi:hypothetical protein
MHLSTRITRTMAAAVAAASLAAAVGAGSASAAGPIDPVAALNNSNVAYGTSWAGGLASGTPDLHWNQNGNLTTPRLVAPGNLYIENTFGLEARLQIQHYSDAAHTNLIATRDGGTKVGTGGFLDVNPIVLGGVTSTATHVHINLQKKIGGVWTTVSAGSEDL